MRRLHLAALLGALLLVALPLACLPTVTNTGGGGIVATGDDYQGRVDAALKQVPTVALSGDGAKVVQEAGFPIRVDRPDAFSNLPAESQAAAVLDDPKVREALLGTDEAAAADLLIEQGVKMVLLHQNVGPSVDDDRRVLSRLYHHAQLDRFLLVRVGPGTLYYSVQRMLEHGLIAEVGGGPGGGDDRRRTYRITARGRAAAEAESQRLAALVDMARAARFLGETGAGR